MLDQSSNLVVNDPAIVSFVHRIVFDEHGDFGPCATLGWVDDDGLLETGVVLHNYLPYYRTIEVTMASCKNKGFHVGRLNMIADYVFNQLNCYTLVIRHDPNHKIVNRICKLLGGTEYVLANLRGPGLDDCMHILTADEARQSKFWRQK